MRSPGGNEGGFAPDEPEKTVHAIRDLLRSGGRLRTEGRLSEAAQQEAASNALLEQLLRRLVPRFRYYARRLLSDSHLAEDAVVEMGLTLCRRLKDHSGRYRYFEQRFNAAVVTLCLDAVKKVRRENDLNKKGRPATAGYAVVSLDSRSGGDDDEAGRLEERIPDPEAAGILTQRLGEVLTEDYLKHLPSARHAQVVADRWSDREWEETASRVGVSLRTARNYYDQSIECLKRIARSEEWEER